MQDFTVAKTARVGLIIDVILYTCLYFVYGWLLNKSVSFQWQTGRQCTKTNTETTFWRRDSNADHLNC